MYPPIYHSWLSGTLCQGLNCQSILEESPVPRVMFSDYLRTLPWVRYYNLWTQSSPTSRVSTSTERCLGPLWMRLGDSVLTAEALWLRGAPRPPAFYCLKSSEDSSSTPVVKITKVSQWSGHFTHKVRISLIKELMTGERIVPRIVTCTCHRLIFLQALCCLAWLWQLRASTQSRPTLVS